MPQIIEQTWVPSGPSYLRGRKESRPFRYGAYLPDPIAKFDPTLPSTVGALGEAAAVATVELNEAPGVEDLEPVARLLLRAESVASSRIEGLRLSHRRLEEALIAPKAARGTALSILRNIEAMAQAVEIGTRATPLSVDDIIAIHSTILNTDRDAAIAGVIRVKQNWIGGGNTPRNAEFIPPPPQFVPDLLTDLVDFCNRDDLPAVVQAAIAHCQFETIHPFVDGNGRVGRSLVHVILRSRGLVEKVVPPISVILAANSATYVRGLTLFRDGDVAGWCEIFANATRLAAERAAELGGALRILREDWANRAGQPRRGSAARHLIENLVSHPIVSVSSARQLLDVSDEAARLALARLEGSEVLRQTTLGRRNRAWAAEEVFDLLDEFDMAIATPEDGSISRPAPTRHLRPPR